MSDWIQVLDEGSGQHYYFNEATSESSWEVPGGWVGPENVALEEVAAAPEKALTTITEGEEDGESVATAGASATGTAEASGSPLWEEVWHEESCQYYYINGVTSETTWEKPEDFGALVASEADAANDEAGTIDEGAAAEAAEGAAGAQEAVPLLPENDTDNWETHWDEDNQLHYYMNTVTQASQWDLPDCINPDLAPPAVSAEQAAEAEAVASGSDAASAEGGDGASAHPPTPPGDGSPKSASGDGESKAGDGENIDANFAFSLLDRDDHDQDGTASKHRTRQSVILANLLGEAAATAKEVEGHSQPMSEQDKLPVPMIEKTVASDSQTPVVDVTQFSPNTSLSHVAIVLKNISFADFVEMHFRAPVEAMGETAGLSPSANSSPDSSPSLKRFADVANSMIVDGMGSVIRAGTKKMLMTWTPKVASLSLCVMNSPENVEIAVSLNRSVMAYMGDRQTHKSQHELVNHILATSLGSNSKRLHDELYCQILRQLRGNPSLRSEEKGFNLLLICLACFPPSAYFAPYFMAFCVEAAQVPHTDKDGKDAGKSTGGDAIFGAERHDTELESMFPTMTTTSGSHLGVKDGAEQEELNLKKEIRRMAELCIRYTIKASKCSSVRSHAPTDEEISSLINGGSQVLDVHFVHSEIIGIPFDSWTTVHDCETRIAGQLHIHEENRCIFSMFEQIRSSSRKSEYDEQPLQGFELIVDILSFHAIDSASCKQTSSKESSSISGAALVDREHSRFVYKARIFVDNSEHGSLAADTDNACTYLLFKQAVDDVLAGNYPIGKADAVSLAGLHAQEQLGDYENLLKRLGFNAGAKKVRKTKQEIERERGDEAALSLLGVSFAALESKHDYHDDSSTEDDSDTEESEDDIIAKFFAQTPVETFLSRHYTGGMMDESKKAIAEKDVITTYSGMKGMSSEDVRIYYMTILRGCKMYGAQYFLVQEQMASEAGAVEFKAEEDILAVTSREVVIFNQQSLTYTASYTHDVIKSWGYSADAIMLEVMPESTHVMKQRGDSRWLEKQQPKKKYYRTENAKAIADLLKSYNVHGR